MIQLFEEQVLLRPNEETPDLVDLSRSLAQATGVDGFDTSAGMEMILSHIGSPDHIVFILIDGLGMNLLERLPAGSILTSCLKMELRSIVPSTTASALTSLATGLYPKQHAVIGWHTHLPRHGRTATILPFVDRLTERPLAEMGVTPEAAFPKPSWIPQMKFTPASILPIKHWDSVYSRYSRGGTSGEGYLTIPDALGRIRRRLARTEDKTYTFLYLPQVDSLCHTLGVERRQITAFVRSLDDQLRKLASTLPDHARLVISADHGLVTIPPGNRSVLMDGDPLLSLLQVAPSGESRFPFFHLRPGAREQFLDLFSRRFAEHFALLSIEEADLMGLLGSGSMTTLARERMGDYLAIPYGPYSLDYHPPLLADSPKPLGRHGALSPEEMRIPLIVV